MADFNPQVPRTNDPNWLGWSKSITQPQPDTSTGEALSTLGTGLGEGIKLADYAVKTGIEDETYDKVRKLQDDQTSALEKADISVRLAQAGGPGTPTGASPATGPKSVYDAPAMDLSANTNAPRDLEKLPDTLGTLDSARGNGKLSETAFYGRLTALAKDLREKYPGYRDYIDKEVERVSGVNPANKYISSLLGDINSFANSGKEEANKIRTQIWDAAKFGIPGADKVLAAFESGALGSPAEAGPKILQWLGPAHTQKLQLEILKSKREEREGQDKDTSRLAEDEANKFLQGSTTNFFNAYHLVQGAPSADKISETIRKANAGEISLGSDQALQLSQAIASQKYAAAADADAYFDKVGPDGRTLRSVLGEKKISDLKAAHLDKFDRVADLIRSEKYGRAYSTMNSIRAQGDDAQYRLLTDPEMGQVFTLGKALDKIGIDENTKKFFQSMLETETGPRFQQWIKRSGLLMSTQPNGPNAPPVTLKDQVSDLRTRTNGENTPETARTYDGLIKSIEAIADPTKVGPNDLEVKRNLARAAFDPKNLGILTQFGEDSYKNGVYKPGKYALFNRLFAPDMTKSISELGGNSWDQYRELGKQMWGRELFGPVLKDFSRQTSLFPDMKISWDSDNHRFVIPELRRGGSGAFPSTGPVQNYEARADFKQDIDRVNNSFQALVNIAKQERTDPNALILGWMKEQGVDLGRLPGIPEKMLDAIVQSQSKDIGEENSRRKSYGAEPVRSKPKAQVPSAFPPVQALQYNEEDAPSSGNVLSDTQRSSLSAFLSNPAGVVAAQRKNAPAASRTRSSASPLGDNILGVSVTGDDDEAFKRINPNY